MPRAKVIHLFVDGVMCGRKDFDELRMTRSINETTCSNCLIAAVRQAENRMRLLGIDREKHPA